MKQSLHERFFSKVRKTAGCWIWIASRNRRGYGQITIGSRTDGTRRNHTAHRVAYELLIGQIPLGACCLHKCDVPNCVNPQHLFLGSFGDNARDRDEKGRTAQGEDHGISKLSVMQVREIRRVYKARSKEFNQQKLAERYGVSFQLISQVVHRQIWRAMQE